MRISNNYKNGLYFIVLPLVFFVLVELYFGWPYTKIGEEARASYLRVSIMSIGIYLFASLVGLAVNFWHYKKLREDFRARWWHMFVCIALLCINYLLTKIMTLGSTLALQPFRDVTGFGYVNFRKIDKTQSSILLLFFLLQCVFAFYTMQRQRSKMETQTK